MIKGRRTADEFYISAALPRAWLRALASAGVVKPYQETAGEEKGEKKGAEVH